MVDQRGVSFVWREREREKEKSQKYFRQLTDDSYSSILDWGKSFGSFLVYEVHCMNRMTEPDELNECRKILSCFEEAN